MPKGAVMKVVALISADNGAGSIQKGIIGLYHFRRTG
jgi:hypothetical protein